MNSLRSQKPYKINQIDFSRIIYHDVSGSDNRKSVLLGYNDPDEGEKRLLFQTTELRNINSLVDRGTYYELDIPLYGKSEKRVDLLVDFFKNLDTTFINEARQKHREWFGSTSNIKYKSIIRNNTVDMENPIFSNGIIKLKILKNKNSNTKITSNKTQTNIDIHDLSKDCYVKMILECFALWITKEGFGLYLKPILIDERSTQDDISFVNDSEDDENKEVNDIIDTEIGTHVKNINIDDCLSNNEVSDTSEILHSNIDTEPNENKYLANKEIIDKEDSDECSYNLKNIDEVVSSDSDNEITYTNSIIETA